MLIQILLQASEPQGSGYSQILFFIAIALIFYFFMIRPQQKKQKEQKKFLEEIKKGDQVVTIGGIHGKILNIDDNMVILEVDKGVKLKLERSSISLEATKKKK